ncbi:MAG: hypothetical protein WAQ25_02860 [Candidatus Saccharimonas sp.]
MKNTFNNLSTPKTIVLLTVTYAFAYLLAGGLAYFLITKQFYVGDTAIFAEYLRSEENYQLWQHVTTWQIPLLLVRSLLIAFVLYPFFSAIRRMSFKKAFWALTGLLFVLTHLAAGAPSPGNIEGMVYMRPEFMSPVIFALVQPEMILQTLLAAGGFTYIIRNWSNKHIGE